MRAMLGQLVRYGLVSAVALAVDWGLLVALTEKLHLHYLVSAGAGFSAGVAVAYTLSILFVFEQRRVSDPRAEFALFLLIGLVGLAANQALLHVAVEWAGLHYALAKAPVAVVVFLMNFGLRRTLLFSAPQQRLQS
jgi:putative flippase GtrA